MLKKDELLFLSNESVLVLKKMDKRFSEWEVQVDPEHLVHLDTNLDVVRVRFGWKLGRKKNGELSGGSPSYASTGQYYP